ncbi:MAG: hypothetical protein U0Q03_04040 [Acidimicrobiales bacterium]
MNGTGTPMVGVKRSRRMVLQGVLITIAVLWLLPMVAAFYASFRYFESDSNVNGVFSLPKTLTLDNYREAWKVGGIPRHFYNTMFVTIPALVLILLLSSMVAFACSRFTWRFNIFFLVLFTAGNLMPQQVISSRCSRSTRTCRGPTG